MLPLEIDSAVFCDGAHYTIISRENSSILTCPVASGAGGYTLNRVEVRDIDREAGRLTGHAACIAVDVPTWCRIAGDPLAHRPVYAGPRRQEGSWFEQTGRDGRRAQARALGTALPVREHAFTRPRPDHIIRAISTSPPLFRGGSL